MSDPQQIDPRYAPETGPTPTGRIGTVMIEGHPAPAKIGPLLESKWCGNHKPMLPIYEVYVSNATRPTEDGKGTITKHCMGTRQACLVCLQFKASE